MKYGYFDDEHREYVIERPDVPVSWTNYLGVRDLCTVISHNAGGYTFYKSSEHKRLTRFRPNGVPLDRPGHYVYIRDDETAEFWSVSWQPVGKSLEEARYEVRHGLSYSVFACDYRDIRARQTLFTPVDDDVLLYDVAVKNLGKRERALSVFNYLEWSFQHVAIDNQDFQMSLYASGASCVDGIIEFDFFYDPAVYHFLASSFEPDGYDCVRDRFIGVYRTESDPAAVIRGACSGSSELGGNHCGALHKRLVLQPGEEARLVFILGVGSRSAKGRAARERYSDTGNVDAAFAELGRYWDRKVERFRVATPHPGMNTMLNAWNLFGAETCIVWSRFSSFVEVGGRTGLGYRDTAQDAMAVVGTNPEKSLQRIVELLSAVTSQGYALHLFDPERFKPEAERPEGSALPTVVPGGGAGRAVHGLEDTCADDALWIVPTVCEWVKETGDLAFFESSVPYADGGEGSVYEHMSRIVDFSAEHVGGHGICQGLRADWNDCLNLGGGESAMVSFLHHWALQCVVEAAARLGREKDVEKYTAVAERVQAVCEEILWDGDWYIRGFTKSGRKIGTVGDDEGKLFLNAQSWAVLSGVASPERGRKGMDATDEHLYSKYGLHMLWPAYSAPNDEIGYVTRVYKGVKENGSIFSHPNAWAVAAECVLGRGGRAMKIYDAILPYNQNDIIEIRQAEPYAYCQFIMGRDHTAHGRAVHPWLTGTTCWMYTAATRFLLGIRPAYDGLTIDPCIPAEWKEFKVSRQWRGATYNITVRNPNGAESGVASITLNGAPVDGSVPPQEPGTSHTVEVLMKKAPE